MFDPEDRHGHTERERISLTEQAPFRAPSTGPRPSRGCPRGRGNEMIPRASLVSQLPARKTAGASRAAASGDTRGRLSGVRGDHCGDQREHDVGTQLDGERPGGPMPVRDDEGNRLWTSVRFRTRSSGSLRRLRSTTSPSGVRSWPAGHVRRAGSAGRGLRVPGPELSTVRCHRHRPDVARQTRTLRPSAGRLELRSRGDQLVRRRQGIIRGRHAHSIERRPSCPSGTSGAIT